MVKEPPKMQDMGPKKYKQMIEKQNKFYDEHKAGKRDRKTGEYYYNISTTDPRKSKSLGGSFCGYMECKTEECDEVFTLKSTTSGIICSKCKKFISFSKEDKEQAKKEYEQYKSQNQS